VKVESVLRGDPGLDHGDDETPSTIRSGDGLRLETTIEATTPTEITSLGVTIGTEGGLLLLNLDTADDESATPIRLNAGVNQLVLDVPELQLAAGRYRVGLRLANPVTTRIGSGAVDLLDPAFVLQVDDGDHTSGHRGDGIGAAADLTGPGRSDGQLVSERSLVAVSQGAGSLVRGSLRVHTD
ncbi:MAG: hypothetical protein AAFO29_04740, partial [Actinomycetota bacterium]